MDPVGMGGAFAHAAAAASLSEADLREKITAITDAQIDFIGTKIVDELVSCLGVAEKAGVAEKVALKKGALGQQDLLFLQMQLMNADISVEKGKAEFLNPGTMLALKTQLLRPVKEKIQEMLKLPNSMLGEGLYVQFSDYQPTEELLEICESVGVEISIDHIPPKYNVRLLVDREKSQSGLVFRLIQSSDGVEFKEETFTLKELEDQMRKAWGLA